MATPLFLLIHKGGGFTSECGGIIFLTGLKVQRSALKLSLKIRTPSGDLEKFIFFVGSCNLLVHVHSALFFFEISFSAEIKDSICIGLDR